MERIAIALGMSQADNRIGGGDSFVDRLSCSYTVLMLGVFAFGLTTKQWLGEVPISCWCPSHFTSSHCDFVNNVCWTHNTYYLPISQERIPQAVKGKAYISYYQWVALVLVCQACLFYMPRILWRMLNKKSGIAVSTITDAAVECQKKLDSESRDSVMEYMIKHMGRFLVELSRMHLMTTSKLQWLFMKLYGNYLIIAYLFIKIIYLINVVGQLFWLNVFLGTDYHMYGFRVLSKMLHGESWSTSDRFPRVNLCDVSVRQMGNIHNYTIQCSLPMNLFNEKIYILVWFWFVFVAFMTFGSLIVWSVISFCTPLHVRYVRVRLIAMNKIKRDGTTYKDVSKFVRNFLRADGIFLIRLVAKNSSDMTAAELICGLWQQYKENKRVIEKLESSNDIHKDTKLLIKPEHNTSADTASS